MARRDQARAVELVLNGTPLTVSGVATTRTLLEFLRLDRRLTGTKEGCAEGDCGACTVAIGERVGKRVRYRAANACILLLPMLHRRAVVTVEALAGPGGELHPAQQALVDLHGSQCGFCTPGFVMSLYAAHGEGTLLARPAINDLLAGNLCRCTGYGPIIAAAEAMFGAPKPAWDTRRRRAEAKALAAMADGPPLAYKHAGRRFFAPTTLDELADLCRKHPRATVLAGATDVGLWVTKHGRDLPTVIHVGQVAELARIEERKDGALVIGAGATYSDAMGAIAVRHPDFGELLRRLGSVQVRNAGTIGGNIANGSPIGDTPPALIALGARLTLRKAKRRRRLALEDYFLAYGRQDRAPGEFVESIEIPAPERGVRLACYKVAKRFDQDIAAVCGCFSLAIEDARVARARIAFGGMAETPRRARAVEAALIGRPWTRASIEAALPAMAADFTPITDMRASAGYRMAAAQGLLVRYFLEDELPLQATRLVGRGARAA